MHCFLLYCPVSIIVKISRYHAYAACKFIFLKHTYLQGKLHAQPSHCLSFSFCVKMTIFGDFLAFISGIRTEHCDLQYKYPYSVRMQEITDQKNSKFTLFLRIVCLHELSVNFRPKVNDKKYVVSQSKFFINVSNFFIISLNSNLGQIFANIISYSYLIHSSRGPDSFIMHDVLGKKVIDAIVIVLTLWLQNLVCID